MAYKGTSSVVQCNKGGLTGAKNIDSIPNFMMVYPTRNILLEKNGRHKRGGTAHLYTNPFTSSPEVMALFDFTLNNLTQYIVVHTADGKLWKDGTNTIKASGWGTTTHSSFAVGENKLFIADGAHIPEVWTGTGNTAAIANPASDWTASPPFQFLMHGRSASQRMLALNKTYLYFSKNYVAAGDMENFTDQSVLTMYIDTEDGYGLTGMVEIGSEVVVFGRRRAYRIDDSSLDYFDWSFFPVQWTGGSVSWRTIVKTPNDVVVMAEDGDVYSVTAVNSYGDYKQASLMKESWMYDWMKDNIDLSLITGFHGVYDPTLKAVLYFVIRNGMTTVDTCMAYFTERPPAEAWMILDNQASVSGYSASCSAIVRQAAGTFKTYTGGYAGHVWKLNELARNDNSAAYYAGFTTANESGSNIRMDKLFNRLIIEMQATTNMNMSVTMNTDGGKQYKTVSMIVGASGSILGVFLLTTDYLAGSGYSTGAVSIGMVGKKIQYEIFNNVANEDFFVDSYATDFKSKSLGQQDIA